MILNISHKIVYIEKKEIIKKRIVSVFAAPWCLLQGWCEDTARYGSYLVGSRFPRARIWWVAEGVYISLLLLLRSVIREARTPSPP